MTISPTDTSTYLSLVGGIDTFPSKDSLYRTVEPAYTKAEYFDESVDLSGYYSNQETGDLYTQVSNNVKQSAAALDEVMVRGLENGMEAQDVVNMTKALRAYQANLGVAKSTFELKI